VSINCEYKRPLKYGDTVVVETTFKNTLAAKIKFDYTIYKQPSREVVATGSTVQVFVDVKTFQLQLTVPLFFEEWKKKQGIGRK
jgi:acyl-CoA thioester hydrolase